MGHPSNLSIIKVFIGMRPTQSISDLAQDIKGDSSKCPPSGRTGINQKRFIKGRFSWQEGFGAFSYSKSHVDNVINYIKNQAVHLPARSRFGEGRS
jgi:putative transposase